MNDTVLGQTVIKCLIDNFGVVQAEHFISLVIKEPFDYTNWQKDLYSDMSVEELFRTASEWKNTSTGKINE